MSILRILLFLAVMLYASYVDCKTMTVQNRSYFLLLLAGLPGVSLDSLIGAALAFVPLLVVGLLTDFGGGDIKYGAMCGFVLQGTAVVPALMIAALSACLVIPIYRHVKKEKKGTSFPFVPFLSFGFAVMTII